MEQVDPALGPQTIRQWSLRLLVPYSAIRAAVKDGSLPYYRFTEKGPIYITAEAMDGFMERAYRGPTDRVNKQ